MSKVNLMIAIDEENYKRIKDDVYDTHDIHRAIISIRKGIPLNDLKEIYIGMDGNAVQIYPNNDALDKIRAEINAIEISGQIDEHTLFARSADGVKDMVLEIIDRYRGDANDKA